MLPNVFFWMWWFYMPPLFRIGILFPKSHEYDWAFAQMHVILYMDIVLSAISIGAGQYLRMYFYKKANDFVMLNEVKHLLP
jgi:hypothetical protein